MFGLPLLDIVVILIYFAAMVGIGFWSMRRIKTQDDFFLGGRRFGKLIQIFANFGQATSSDTGPSVATTTYHNGAAGVWSALLMLFATPFFWFTAPWYRRMRSTTLGDFYEERYNSKAVGGAYSLISSIGLCILLSLSFVMMVKTVQAMTPKPVAELTQSELAEMGEAERLDELRARDYGTLSGEEKTEMGRLQTKEPRKFFSTVSAPLLVFSMVLVVCLYSITGGLEAAFVSDMIQGVFILVLSVMLIPFAISAINVEYGGSGALNAFRVLHDQKSESFFQIFGSPHNIDFTWYYIAAVSFMALINASAQANTFVTPSSSKDEFSARFGMTFGIYLKRFSTVMWGVTAMFAVLLFADKIADPDLLWGVASRELLGPLNMGLIGLMIAAMMAALMSTADMMMITTSGLLTHGVYRPLVQGKPDKHYVMVGRLLGGIVVVGAALIALGSGGLLDVLKLWWEFGVIFSAAMWLGILWRRTNRKAVWVQLTVTLVLFFLLPLLLPAVAPGLKSNDYLTSRTEARVVVNTYRAAKVEDVSRRAAAIEAWEAMSDEAKAGTTRPEPVVEGQEWTQQTVLPRKALFWSKGLELGTDPVTGEERLQAKGGLNMLRLELVLLDLMGANLANTPHALNQTYRVLIITFIPFIILVVVSLLTKRDEEEEMASKRVAAKMLTPLAETPEADEREIAMAYENPHRQDHLKLFGPHSNWQFRKWTKTDGIGFIANVAVVVVIMAALFFFVNLGK